MSQPSDPRPNDDPSTVTEVVQDMEPMGDLARFAIEDLTPEEEDEFFGILEDL